MAIIDKSFPDISIHALVKRATSFIVYIIPRLCISIHALVKRATCCKNMAIQQAMDFNPRPRKEGDIRFLLKTRQKLYFNPRPRKEGDDCSY